MLKQTICLMLCVLLLAMIGNTGAEIEPKRCPPCKVTKEYKPVCGTDNQTYANWRKLACKNRCHGTEIAVDYRGVCLEK